MAIETVVVTGGSGKVGSRTVQALNDGGYETVNLDVETPPERRADSFIDTDLLDAGEVYGAFAKADADAFVHMGTLPVPTRTPGYVTFKSNVMSSYYVLEAATAFGLEAGCLASSVNALGRSFQEEPPEIYYLPVDEEHPVTPRDPYGLGKHVIEEICDGFGRRRAPPDTLSTLRYPWVGSSDDLRSAYAEDDRSLSALRTSYELRDSPLFGYGHVDDIARAARHTIEADFKGHETFWITAADTNTTVPTATLVDEFYPDIDPESEFSGYEALFDLGKAHQMLGWTPQHSWRNV